MIPGKICALMATANRPTFVARAVNCFLRQDYPNRHLWILNNCETPLHYDHPMITVINEPGHRTLGDCRNRLLQFADGEMLRIFDDDDIHFVWAFSQGVEHIGNAPAWKPARSWWCDGSGQANGYSQPPGTFALAANAMEASITWRTQAVRDAGGWYAGQGNESRMLLQRVPVAQQDMGIWPGYCYMHGCGQFHASATIGQAGTEAGHAHAWAQAQQPVAVPSYQEECRRLVRFIEPQLQTPWLLAAMGAGPAHASPMEFQPAKIMAHYAAARKFAGKRVIIAPGCWDLLHAGHVYTLEAARRHAGSEGKLVALVNDDAGVTAQKGTDRPLLPLSIRAGALSSLDCVDAVVAVAGADDREAIEAIKPAAIIKGPEYSGRKVCNSEMVNELIIASPSPFKQHTSDLSIFAST